MPSISDIELDVFVTLCEKIGTPLATEAKRLVLSQDWLGLLSLKAEPAQYSCAKTYLEDTQVVSFLKKYPGFQIPGVDLEAEAISRFYLSESQCYHTNERLSPLLCDISHYGEDVGEFITRWRKKIRASIGRAPKPNQLNGRFGPGSTFRNVGDKITVAHKLSDDYTATRQAGFFLHSWDQTAWSRYAACGLDTEGTSLVSDSQGSALYEGDSAFAIRDFQYVRGNRFTTVAKDALKLRGICIEPSLNVFYQLAIGSLLSKRMKTSLGWDKETQQDYHRNLARLGSLTGAVATLDLSNASDTVSSNLVKLLLPRDWYDLVDRLRSSHTLVKGKWVKLEKFSSMGNGYTFELETLIFFTLCETVSEMVTVNEDAYTPGLTISVFGDDIIIPTSISSAATAALNFFGFTLNSSKSFVSGKFRESCGGDFFAGHDVRPHFQKEVCDEPHRLISLANGLRRFGRRHDDLGGNGTYRVAWFRCLDSLPRQISICRGPESLGDLVVQDDEEHWLRRNPIRVRSSIRYLRVWRPVPNRIIGWEHFRPGVVLAYALYGGSSGLSNSYVHAVDIEDYLRRSGMVPRISGSYVSGYRHGRVAYS